VSSWSLGGWSLLAYSRFFVTLPRIVPTPCAEHFRSCRRARGELHPGRVPTEAGNARRASGRSRAYGSNISQQKRVRGFGCCCPRMAGLTLPHSVDSFCIRRKTSNWRLMLFTL
jgi:hypothetical protein